MSSDNGLVIRINKAGKYVLQEYSASADDYPDLESAKSGNVFDTLEEAVLASSDYDTEYGLKIDMSIHKKEEDLTKVKTAKFVRVPFEVEAVQVTAENIEEVAAWCNGTVERLGEDGKDDRYIHVRVHYPISPRQTKAFIGDWVLYSKNGFKCYNPVAFKKNFVLADETGVTIPRSGDSPA